MFRIYTWMCDTSHIADVNSTSHNAHFLRPSISTTYWSLGNEWMSIVSLLSSLEWLFEAIQVFEWADSSDLGAINRFVLLSSDELCVDVDAVFIIIINISLVNKHKN